MLVEPITSTTVTQNVKDNGLKTFNIEDEMFVLIRAIDLETKNAQLKSFSETINCLSDDVEKKDHLLKLQSDKIKTLSATKLSLKSQLKEKDESIFAYEQKLREVETQIVKEREDYEATISNIKSYFTFIQNNKIESLGNKISSLNFQLEEKDENIVNYEQKLQEVETQIVKEREDYEATILSWKLKYETLNSKFKVLQTKFKNLNSENSVNKKLLTQLKKEHGTRITQKIKLPTYKPSTQFKNTNQIYS
jgi:chromosome segregation ATPase